QGERHRAMTTLWAAATEAEQNHLYRVLTGELRQGANEGVVADAVAKASGQPIAAVRRAAMLLGNLGAAAVRALDGQSLDVGLTPLTAVQPMLAGTSASVADALAEIGLASVEWKLDGIRVQAHKSGEEVRLFSRGLNDITAALPGVVDLVRRVPVRSVVLDGEALGIGEDGQPLIFQDTMSGLAATGAYFFDVLHLDDESLIDHPLRHRRSALEALLPSTSRLPSIVTADADEAEAFAANAVATGHEGVMVKAIESLYEAGRRGTGWRKVKPVHTLDLVVLAAEWGHGRRVGWLSNLHLGARGADGFVMVGKTFKGMTDDLLRWQTDELQRIAIATEGHTVHVRPELVVEIAIDGVQRSTRYPGGVALRFARVRRYRLDKTSQDADTIERVQSMLGGVR
ncbi:MAG: ligase 1, partial [Ilumatobacteraceae bacterium]